MTKRSTSLVLRGWKCRRGIAATEFALLLPAIFTLFFGTLELADVMTTNRKVVVAVNTMVDLSAQAQTLTPTQIDQIIDGVESILEPGASPLVIKLISVIPDVDGDPVVHWSYDNTNSGNPPYTDGDDFLGLDDDVVLNENGSLIAVEVDYQWTPRFAGHFVQNPFTFARNAVRWPRLSSRVQLCDNSGQNCTQ